MVRVAVAGGSSPTLGRSIVTALLNGGKHDVVILSSKTSGTVRTSSLYSTGDERSSRVSVLCVDYGSIDSLASALHDVHTLISVLKVPDPDTMIAYHSNMLKACVVAKVSRFVPSAWSLGPGSYPDIDLLANKQTISKLCEELGVKNGIECASFHCGGFLNYLAQGLAFPDTPAGSQEKEFALGGLVDDLMLEYINIPKGRLVVPVNNDGEPSPLTFTHIDDIGKFVAAAIDLPPGQWQQNLGMAGDTRTLKEVFEILRSKGVQVQQETINSQQCNERIVLFDLQLAKGFSLDALLGKMVAQMVKVQCEGTLDAGVIRPTLNELCPHVDPVSIQEFIDRLY